MKNKSMNTKHPLFFYVSLKTRVSKSKPAAVLMNPDDLGLEKMAQCLLLSDKHLHFSTMKSYISSPAC